jgi:predicted Rossmann fold nucleotide-binding protein DprA/Smf involved in DNA uptake
MIRDTLLLCTRSSAARRRPTAQLVAERNRLVATLADIVFVAHAAPSGKTLEICRKGCGAAKALYTLDDPANAELISLGAKPLAPADVLWFSPTQGKCD